MYRRIGLFLLLCGFLLSCKESEKERISRLVSEWDGKEIVFPSAPVFTVQGRDTVSCPSGTSPYKVLTYIDSGLHQLQAPAATLEGTDVGGGFRGGRKNRIPVLFPSQKRGRAAPHFPS